MTTQKPPTRDRSIALRHILLATDFTRAADEALELALRIASAFDASLTLVRVIDPTLAEGEGGSVNRFTPGGTRELLKGIAEECTKEGTQTRSIVEVGGDPSRGIVEVAAREGADLIVMGSNLHTGFRRAVLGSVAESVVRTSSIPVLTVPTSQSAGDIYKPAGSTKASDPPEAEGTAGRIRVPPMLTNPLVLLVALVVVTLGFAYVYSQEQRYPKQEEAEHAGPKPVQQVGR